MLKDANTHVDPITNNTNTLVPGSYYRFYDKKSNSFVLHEFLGYFDRVADVPEQIGFFILNGEDRYFLKELDEDKYNKEMERIAKEKAKNMKVKSNNLLDCNINSSDDELKIMVKRMLDGLTNEDFKKLFDNVTVCNNMKGAIFGDKDLSWKRFSEMCRLLNCTYRLEINKGDKIIKNTEEGI